MAEYKPFPRCKGGDCGGDPKPVLKTGGVKGNPADMVFQCTPPVPPNCPPATGGTCACYIVLIKHGPVDGILGGADDEEKEEKIFPAQPDPTQKDPYSGMLTQKTASADYSPQGRPAGKKRPTYWEYRCRCLDTSGGTPPLAMIERKHDKEFVAVVVAESERLG